MSQTVVGKLNKAFGIKGQIKVIPEKPFISDLKKSDVWFIERGNTTVPYFVESFEEAPHFLIKFEDIDSPEAAKSITGCPILLRDKDISIQTEVEESDLDKLVGFNVENDGVHIGKIIKIEEFPQQLMAFVENDNVDFLLPLTPEFITDINLDTKRLYVILPDGFIESQV